MVLTDRVGSSPTSGTRVWQAGQKPVPPSGMRVRIPLLAQEHYEISNETD